MDKVSIIIPCYNHGKYIIEAIDSVRKQTYTNWEIIIVNDGSNDFFTNQVINQLSFDKGKVLITSNYGLSSARNYGIKNSTGDFIVLLDADNKLSPTFIEEAIFSFNEHKVDIIYTDGFYFDEQDGNLFQEELTMPKMLTRNLIDACSIFKKEVFYLVGGFNINMNYGWEDWDFWLSAYEKKCTFFHLNKQLFYYRVVNDSMLHNISSNIEKRQSMEQQLINNHIFLYQKYFPEPVTLIRNYFWLEQEQSNFELVKKQIYGSYSYRIGDMLLRPLKLLNKLFK
jgi:glycosyltransferase involved in cell wall biosynthesis